MRKGRHLVWLLPLLLCGCDVDEGSPRATVRFTGAYRGGETFADGTLIFNPGSGLLGAATDGMRPGERRHAEIPVPECPGSPRFVEFGNPDDGKGSEEQFRYRRDRGPLLVDLEMTALCVPTWWVFMRGSIFEGRFDRLCRRIDAVEPSPASTPEQPSDLHLRPGDDLGAALITASFGWGKDREVADVGKVLDAGADPNAVNKEGKSALALAAGTGNRAIPRLLYQKGARLAGSKFDGPFGIHQAAADGQIEILRALLVTDSDSPNPRDLNALDGCGFTPLLLALRNEPSPLYDCIPGFTPDYRGVVVDLLERHADPRIRQGTPPAEAQDCVGDYLPTGANPLQYAATACNKEVAELLLAHGAEADSSDDMGDTPLMAAAHAGCAEVVALLLDRGAALERQDGHGGGPALVHAVYQNSFVQDNVRTVALLLERGAKPQAAREMLESFLRSPTGHGFGRKGLKNAREIARMLKRAG
jgi:ankyrin repeat protein